MPFWALFALPLCTVASDHSYGPGDPPHGGNISWGVYWGRLAHGGAGGLRVHTGFQRAVRAYALVSKMGVSCSRAYHQAYVDAVENQTPRFVRSFRALRPPNDPKGLAS